MGMRVVVIGAGAWGTALAILLARNGQDVVLYARTAEEATILAEHRENIRYLPGFALPDGIAFQSTSDPIDGADLAVVAVPSGGVRDSARGLARQGRIVVASKGLEVSTGKLLTQVVAEECPEARVGALSGPNLAVEIVRGVPTAAVTAFPDPADADVVRQAFKCRTFRVYATDDVIGIQLAGALKNVIAIAAGISDGLGFGDNTKGALVARGLREMQLLGAARGAKPETFTGIAGIGDLFATAASPLSRNYRVGRGLGEGRDLAAILEDLGQVAEGVPTSEAAAILARDLGVQTPVMNAIREVLEGRMKPLDGVGLLMDRETPDERLVTL